MKKVSKLIIAALIVSFTGGLFAQAAGGGALDPTSIVNTALSALKIEFAVDKYTPSKDEVTNIVNTVAPKIKSVMDKVPEGQRIFVIGHTDSTGTKEYNKELSIARARAVYAKLIGAGVPAKLMEYVGVRDTEGVERTVTFKLAKLGDIVQK